MKLIPEAKQSYKLTSIQAAMGVAALEAIRSTDLIHIPSWLMVILIVAIAVLRVIKQSNIK